MHLPNGDILFPPEWSAGQSRKGKCNLRIPAMRAGLFAGNPNLCKDDGSKLIARMVAEMQ
jgi:hypothetical protein